MSFDPTWVGWQFDLIVIPVLVLGAVLWWALFGQEEDEDAPFDWEAEGVF